jgi:multidrug efflux system outer membrane protein
MSRGANLARPVSRLASLALASALGACALGPKIAAPSVSLPAAYEAAPATAPSVAIDRWWRLYGDPQLASLVEEALARAPDARIAEARLDEAFAVRSQALAAYGPQGGAQSSAAYVDTKALAGPPPVVIPGVGTLSLTNSGSVTEYGASAVSPNGLGWTWEVDVFGRRLAARKEARGDLAAAVFDYETLRADLAADVADQLFEARGLALQLEDALRTAAIDHQLIEAVRAKDRNGVAAAPDLDQAESEAAQADAQAARLGGELRADRRTLLVLLGRGGDALETLEIPAEAGAPPAMPASVPGELLERRPDVREAAARIISAAGKLELDELALFPTFTLQPGINVSSALSLGFPLTTASWTAGIGVYQPVFEIPRLRAEIRAQGARAVEAVTTYEKAVQTAYGEAANGLGRLEVDEARLSLLAVGEARGRAGYDAAQARYAAGVDDFTQLLSAEKTWRAARASLTDAKIEALRQSVLTFKALGGGWSPAGKAAKAEGEIRKASVVGKIRLN